MPNLGKPPARFFDGPIALLAALALAASGACSSNSGPKYPTVTSFCEGLASAECNDQVLLACGVPSQATCVAKRQALCVAAQPAGTIYNASAADGCVNEASNAYADAQLTNDESNAVATDCAAVYDGPGGMGAACGQDQDCMLSAGLHCVFGPASTQGTCQTPQQVQGGDSCAAANAQCASGFHCGATAHCDQDALLNASCGDGNPCGPQLMCSSGGTCVALAADGTVCTNNDQCLNGICNEATTASSGLCVSEVNLAPNEPFCLESQ